MLPDVPRPRSALWLAVRAWWDDVPEPDKGIVTGAVVLFGSLGLLLVFLVLGQS